MANKDMTYEEAAHAMQSGVAFDHGRGSDDGSPKHLRTGLNSAMVTDKALATLLIEKGVFTREEYCEHVRRAMVEEIELYEQRLSAAYGKKVTLG